MRCPRCGYDYSDFKRIGRFGCPDCYQAFAAQLEPMLRQVHGGARHRGKVPPARRDAAARRQRLAVLRAALEQAVRAEEYEKAAEIRDEIRTLESGDGAPGCGEAGSADAPDARDAGRPGGVQDEEPK